MWPACKCVERRVCVYMHEGVCMDRCVCMGIRECMYGQGCVCKQGCCSAHPLVHLIFFCLLPLRPSATAILYCIVFTLMSNGASRTHGTLLNELVWSLKQ